LTTASASYGACYTFNSELNPDDEHLDSRISSMTGPFFGLSLVLNLQQKAYLKGGITKQAGGRITIHDKSLRPMVDEFGNDLMPNALTEAAISEVFIERLPPPYAGDCVKDWEKTNYSDYTQPDWSYTLQQCQRVCSHSSIVEACGCFHPMFLDGDIANRSSYNLPVFESETINGTVFNYTYDEDIQACNLTSEADDLVCVEDVMYQLDNSVRNCTCRPNCQELDYEVYISQSKWPSKFYQTNAMVEYGFESGTGGPNVAENLLQVNVYFKSLNVRTVIEEPIYDRIDGAAFISALGGALSLFLGISISMVFEVIEFVIDLTLNICLLCGKGKKKVDDSEKGGTMEPYSAGFDYKEPIDEKTDVKIAVEE